MSDLKSMMPRYEGYKDSGVEWIGEIPAHWEVEPLKYRLDLISERFQSKQMKQLCYGMENIESWTGRFINGQTIVEGLVNKFCKHDILFGKLRPYLAKVALAKWDGLCSTEFLVYRIKDDKPISYYKYLLLSGSFIYLIDSSTYGSKMPRASATFIGNQKLPIPPRQTQTTIANFLDCKTTKIDQAVAIKKKQIQLLKERKQILIQTAVTKGLDPNVLMRDSGAEWIGKIPKHWKVFCVKRIFRLVADPSKKNNNHELLSIYTEIGVKPRKELKEKGNKASTTDGYWLVQQGDFIVNKLLAWMGAIGLSEYKGVTSPAYDILRPIKKIDGYFYHFLFRTKECSAEMKKHSKGIMDMRLRLYFDKFGMIEVPYPPKTEQKAIVTHIQTHSVKIDKAIAIQEQMIDKLKEYKATLINSAVTGKIKVPQTVEIKAVA